jgi:hypothetical protein
MKLTVTRVFFLFTLFLAWDANANIKDWPPKWLDYREEDYNALLKIPESDDSKKLSSLIQEYNKIDKTDIKNLGKRIQKLESILSFLKTWQSSAAEKLLKKKLQSLIIIGKNKAWYLGQLKKGYASGRFDFNYTNVLNELTEVKRKKNALILKRREVSGPYLEGYWGDFWLEYLDPCHRRIWSFYELWAREKKKNPTIPHFFMWLEDKNLSTDIPFTHYFDDEDLEKSKVILNDEKKLCYQHNGKIVSNSSETRNVFVVNLENQLLIAKGSSTTHHGTLARGKPVLAAGIIDIQCGEVVRIIFESGHYRPDIEEGRNILLLLQRMGIELKADVEIGYFNDFGKQVISVKKFNETSNDILLAASENISFENA